MPSEAVKALEPGQLIDALMQLPGWELKGKQIVKQYVFRTFADAMEFANAVAATAEARKHHPDIHISGTKVKLLLWTHRVSAVTILDVKLAEEFEKSYLG